MKQAIRVFLGIALFLLTMNVDGAEFKAPSPPNVTHSLGDTKSESSHALAFDPILETNPNRGSFHTRISVPLPPNLVGLSEITLKYNSEWGENEGVGMGWKWTLPKILPNRKPGNRSPFVTEGLLGHAELVATSESLAALQKEATRVVESAGLGTPGFSLAAYRPSLEEDFTLFAKVEGSADLGWIAFLTNGARWLFDPHGLPIAVVDPHGSRIRLAWSEGLLRRVSETRRGAGAEAWKVELLYSAPRPGLPVWTAQGFQHLPLGLDSIHIGERVLEFKNDAEGFLLFAGWKGGTLPLFQGSYSALGGQIRQEGNSFKRNDDVLPYRTQRGSRDLRGLKVDPNGNTLDVLVDLNGDGVTDHVKFDLSADHAAGDLLWRTCFDDQGRENTGGVDILKAHIGDLTGAKLPSSVEMAVNRRSTGNSQWMIDPSLALPGEPRPFSHDIDWNTDGVDLFHGKPALRCKKFTSNPEVLFFVDLDGDGRLDMVECGIDSSTTKDKWEIENDPWSVKNGYGNPMDVKRSHSNVALGALSLLQPSALPPNHPPFTNPFSIPGQSCRVYLQAPDEGKLGDWLSKPIGHGDPDVSFLVNTSRWIPVPNPGFKAHLGSLFFDANHDGRMDVLTGNTLYLGTDSPGVYEAVTVNPADYLQAVPGEKYDFTDPQMMVADVENNGKLQVRQARSMEMLPATGEIELVGNGVTRYLTPSPRAGRLLTQIHSAFGGAVQIGYTFREGAWVVNQIDREPGGTQPKISSHFDYLSAIVDPFRGLFVGFGRTAETLSSSDSRMAPRKTERDYYQDLDPAASVFLSRSRVNGTPKEVLTFQLDGPSQTETLISRDTSRLVGWDLGNYRSWIYTSTDDELLYAKSSPRTILDRKTSVTQIQPNSWAVDSKGNRILPLMMTLHETGLGLPSVHSSQQMETERTTKTVEEFHPEAYRLLLRQKTERDKDQKQYTADLGLYYNDDLDLLKACHGERCDQYKIDPLGRLADKVTFAGKETRVEYEGDFPLPLRVITPDGTESRNYNPLTGLINWLQIPTGAVFTRHYTTDGILIDFLQQEKANTSARVILSFFGGRPPVCFHDGTKPCLIPNAIGVTALDTEETWNLDGFGRVESTVERGSAGSPTKHSGTSVFGKGSEILAKTRASWASSDSKTGFLSLQLDSLGRQIGQSKLWKDSGTHDILISQYDGPCRTDVLNGAIQSGECRNLFGNIQQQWMGSERLVFGTTADGTLLSVDNLGLSWENDLFAEVTQTASSFEHADTELFSGSAEWRKDLRAISISKEGLLYRESSGLSRQMDSSGRLKSAYKDPAIGGATFETDTDEARDYSGGVLSHRKITRSRNGSVILDQNIERDGYGNTKSWSAAGLAAEIPIDTYGRAMGLKLSSGGNRVANIDYGFKAGKIDSILANGQLFVTHIERDLSDRVTAVHYGNGAQLSRRFEDLSERLLEIEFLAPQNQSLWKETRVFNPATHQVTGRTTSSSLHLGHPQQESFIYDDKTYQMSPPTSKIEANRNAQDGNVAQLEGEGLSWRGDRLHAGGKREFYYDGDGSLAASCPVGVRPESEPGRCIIRIDPDLFLWEGAPTLLLRVDGVPVGLYQNGQFYPVITDALGSVRGLVTTDGKTLKWERDYGIWGNKAKVLASENEAASEASVPWSYAEFFEVGAKSSEGNPIYFSASRAYSPVLGEWLSPDRSVQWNPGTLISRPGNWHPVRYAANRPLEYVDPTGNGVEARGFLGRAAGALVGGAVAGIAAYGNHDTWSQIAKMTFLGAVVGGLGTVGKFGSVVGGAFLGVGAKVVSNYIEGKTISLSDVVVGGIAGAGGVIGGALLGRGYSLLPTRELNLGSTLTPPISAFIAKTEAEEAREATAKAVEVVGGGVVGGGIDAALGHVSEHLGGDKQTQSAGKSDPTTGHSGSQRTPGRHD